MNGSWENVVPAIEAVAPGVEAVVIPHGAWRFLSPEGLPVRAYVVGAAPERAAGPQGAREVALVDAGYATRLSIEAIASAVGARRVTHILLTHGHPDHAGGAPALAARYGAQIVATGAEAAPVEVAGRRLEPIFAPGHTRDHVVWWEREAGLLFSGDTILGEGTVVVGPPEGDMRAYMETLERLRALEPLVRILPGHGPPVDNPQEKIEQYIRHRRMREAQVIDVLRARGSATADDVVAAVYAGTVDPALLSLARISALGQLEKLAAEGRAVRDGERYRPANGDGAP